MQTLGTQSWIPIPTNTEGTRWTHIHRNRIVSFESISHEQTKLDGDILVWYDVTLIRLDDGTIVDVNDPQGAYDIYASLTGDI